MTWLDFLIIKVNLFAVNYSQSLDSALTVLTNDLRSLFIRAVTNTLMQSMKSRGPSTELCSTPQGVLALLKIHEINHIWTTEIKWKWRNDRRSERNLCNCVKKPEKNSGLQRGLNPWPRDYRCDALPTELWSQWRWEQVNCGFICSRERNMNPQMTCSQRQWLHSSVVRASHRSRVQTPLKSWIFFRLLYAIA